MADEPLVNVFDSDNKLVSLPQSQVQAATSIGGGYQMATPEEVKAYQLQEQYGGPVEASKAFLEAAARSSTFGLSTGLERAMDVSPKDIQGRQEANPIVSTAGDIAGLAGSAFIPFGEGALLGKAGATASEALGLGAEGASALSRVGSQAVKGAVETGLFQSGNEVHKMFAEDPSQTFGTAMADIGLSGLFGAAAGGALGSISPLWESTAGRKVSSFLETLQKHANGEEVAPIAEAAAKEALPLAEKTGLEASKNLMAERVSQLAQNEGWDLAKSRQGEILNDVLSKLPKVESVEDLQALRKDVIGQGLKTGMQDAAGKINGVLKEVEPLLTTPVGEAPAVEAAVQEAAPTPGISDTLKQKIKDSLPGAAMALVSMFTGHNPAVGFVLGHLGKLLSSEAEPITVGLMKMLASAAPVDAGAFKAVVDYAAAAAKGEVKLHRGVESLFKSGATIGTHTDMISAKDAKKLDSQLEFAGQDPTRLLNIGGKTSYYAPEHGQQASETAMKAVNYFNSIRPAEKRLGPLDPPMKPSAVEVEKYNRALTIANKPLVVLDHMKNGTLLPEDVVTLKMVYPGLYDRMSQKIMNQIVDGKDVPYKLRFGLSMFLMQPMDSTFMPQNIMSTQATFQIAQSQPIQSKGPHSFKELGKMPNLAMTPGQSREADRMKG